MARFDIKPNFSILYGTSLRSGQEALYIRRSDEFMLEHPDACREKKIPYKVLDVMGARDGAGSVVHAKWHDGTIEISRVKETPEKLKEAFAKAKIAMPPVEKSLGRRLRDIQYAIRVPNIV